MSCCPGPTPICEPKPYKKPTTCCNTFANPLNRATVTPKWVPKCNQFANPANRANATADCCRCKKSKNLKALC